MVNFTYTYRAMSGALEHGSVAAESRADAMRILAAKSIHPVTLQEGGAAPDNGAGKFISVNPVSRKYLVVGVAIFVVVLGLLWFFGPGLTKAKATSKQVKHVQKTIALVQPKVVVKQPKAEKPIRPDLAHSETGRPLMYPRERPPTATVFTNGLNRAKTLDEKVFSNGADQLIACLLYTEMGESLVGDSASLYGPSFLRQFKKSLETPIIIMHDDPPEVKQMKQAVIDTKTELKQRMDAGEDICQILAATRDQVQELGLYRQELEENLKKVSSDPTLTDQDLEDYIKAANIMLKDRGANELVLPKFFMRRAQLLREKAKAQQGQGVNQ